MVYKKLGEKYKSIQSFLNLYSLCTLNILETKQNHIHPMTCTDPRKGSIPQIFSQMNVQFLVNYCFSIIGIVVFLFFTFLMNFAILEFPNVLPSSCPWSPQEKPDEAIHLKMGTVFKDKPSPQNRNKSKCFLTSLSSTVLTINYCWNVLWVFEIPQKWVFVQ